MGEIAHNLGNKHLPIQIEDGKIKTSGSKDEILPEILNQVNGTVCEIQGKAVYNG